MPNYSGGLQVAKISPSMDTCRIGAEKLPSAQQECSWKATKAANVSLQTIDRGTHHDNHAVRACCAGRPARQGRNDRVAVSAGGRDSFLTPELAFPSTTAAGAGPLCQGYGSRRRTSPLPSRDPPLSDTDGIPGGGRSGDSAVERSGGSPAATRGLRSSLRATQPPSVR